MTLPIQLKEELLAHIFGNSTLTSPSNVYLALVETGMEPMSGYSRQEVTFEAAGSLLDGTSFVINDSELQFDNTSGMDWTIDEVRIYDASSGGNELWKHLLEDYMEVGDQEALVIPKSELVVRMGELYPLTESATWSTYLQEKILDHLFNGQSYTAPDIYVALCKSEPSVLGDGSSLYELSGNGYSRVQESDWGGLDTIENNNPIDFAQATGDWAGITHAALVDASTGGNLLGFDVMTTTGETVPQDDTARFDIQAVLTTAE